LIEADEFTAELIEMLVDSQASSLAWFQRNLELVVEVWV